MIGANTLAAALLLAASGGGWARAQAVATHGPPAVAASLLDTERAFAARSLSAGAATAFAEYMDPTDSRGFDAGDPLRGAAAIAKSHDDGARLAWSPREVFASQGGDMGAVWGVWDYTPPKAAKPLITGRYVNVWRKDAAGAWKAIIDVGVPDAVQAKP